MAGEPKELYDALLDFSAGINNGVAALLLQKNQLSNASNATVRGSFIRPRPPIFKLTLDDDSKALLASAISQGPYQRGTYFKPDNAAENIVASIAGRLFRITPDPAARTAVVTEHTIGGDPNPAAPLKAWLWQSEKWVIVNNGINNPIFFDNNTAVRSNFNTPQNFDTTVATAFTIPAVATTVSVTFTSAVDVLEGDIITVQNKGTYQVTDISGAPVIVLTNLTSGPVGTKVNAGTALTWTHLGTQLPPGLMGAYGLGRNWMVLPDGKQFVASDLVGGSSGTQANSFRDAVLQITENLYLAGGGFFTVPGSVGDIQAMHFTSTLDVSLGQGPLQVFTPTSVFSCKAPVDRLEWQDVTNPILTQSLISNGGVSQEATFSANGDTLFRSIDGIRSLILARRDFDTWGNVPISREVEPQLSKDSPDLLSYANGAVFDNRALITVSPVLHEKGVYWRGLIPLNFDPISSLRGKAPSVYDSTVWSGINILQIFVGQFRGVERCYALTLNLNVPTAPELELWEVLRSSTLEVYDNGNSRITWTFDGPILDFGQKDPRVRELLRLLDGEIAVDQLVGPVDFQVWYRADEGCWTPWFAWPECAKAGRNGKMQYRPRMGLGEPRPDVCDEITGRPAREGYLFQTRFVITGQCRFLSAKFRAITLPQPAFAKQSCEPICFTDQVMLT